MGSNQDWGDGPGGSGRSGADNCGGVKGGANQLICLLSDPFANQFKATSIYTALGTSVGFMILIVVLFSLIRPRNSVVYAPKLKYADDKHAPPVIGKGFLDWWPPLMKVHEGELSSKIGLDATIFLRFTKMCRNMMVILCIPALGLVLPTNLISSNKNKNVKQYKATGFWTFSTPQFTTGSALWAHVIAAYVVDGIVVFFLWRAYGIISKIKKNYYQSPEYLQSLHARTLMLIDIPTTARSDEGILRLLDSVEQTGGIPNAVIARNVKELPQLIEQHEKAVRELESVLAKYLKNPDKLPARPTMRPGKGAGGSVDSIDYLMDRILNLEMEIKHTRDQCDKRNTMPYGFASYERIEEAHNVAYAARKKKPQGSTVTLAPRPTDIIWKNMPLSPKDKKWKRFINGVWILLLTIVWIAPNALIAIFLSNLSNLAHLWPGFSRNYRAHPKSWAIVQGIASPALTSLIYVLLPIAFRRLLMHGGDTTKTARERHVAQKLYAFFCFNNLIVFSAFSGVWAYVSTIIGNGFNEKMSVWERIKQENGFRTILGGLIEVSPFWLTWLLQRNLGSAADLAQMIQLSWIWFGKSFTSPTPRQRIELTAPCMFDYAVYFNYFLFYSTVALCFATIQPLAIPICALFFIVDYWLKKYLLLYVLITKHESAGSFWVMLFNRFIFATILANCVMALTVKAYGNWIMVACMAPLPIIMIGFKFYCARTFDDGLSYYTKAITHKDPENMADPGKKPRGHDRLGRKFAHPALNAKLMTPMVHAKAAPIINTLYRGNHRAAQDQPLAFSAQQTGTINQAHGDHIAMGPLSQSGKSAFHTPNNSGNGIASATGKRGLFELVPENKLDFGYFKSRADFIDEVGGEAELYGQTSDHVSERGRDTPMSFGYRHEGSPSSSRASSPAPSSNPNVWRGMSPRSQQQMMQNMYAPPRDPTSQQSTPYHDRNASNGSGGGYFPHQPHSRAASGGNQRPGFYRGDSGESRSELVRGAAPPGQSGPYDQAQGREIYGMERWRTGGSGYQAVNSGDDVGYDAYRGGRGGPYEAYRHG